MASWKDFEGLKSIKDSYKYEVAKNLIKNELGGISNGYMLSHAGTGNSGWSFGGHQYDLSVNKEGRELIKDILDRTYGKEFYLSIKDNLIKAKDTNSLDKDTINKIDKALNSEYGKELINKDFIKAVDKVCSHIDKVEDKLGISLSSGEKLMLADYHNQYGLSLNSSSSASLINKMSKLIEEKGDISKEDLKSLFEQTKYYKNVPSQKNRVEETYNNAVELDKNLNTSSNIEGINKLEELSRTLITRFEDNKEEKVNNLELAIRNINNQPTIALKIQALENINLASNVDNVYSKQLIEQYQEKLISNNANSLSNSDIMSIEIKQDLNMNKESEKVNNTEYISFSSQINANQQTQSNTQTMG